MTDFKEGALYTMYTTEQEVLGTSLELKSKEKAPTNICDKDSLAVFSLFVKQILRENAN